MHTRLNPKVFHRGIHIIGSVVGLFAPFIVHESILFVAGAVSVPSYFLRRPLTTDEMNQIPGWWFTWQQLITFALLPLTVIILALPYGGAPWYYQITALVLLLTSCTMLLDDKSKDRKI